MLKVSPQFDSIGLDCIQELDGEGDKRFSAATSIETRGRLLAALVSGLPQGLLRSLGSWRGSPELEGTGKVQVLARSFS